MSKQQKQTKIFFEKEAKNWSIRADQKSNKIPNTIIQRNSFVFDMIKKYKKKNHLDIGCGSGDLCYASSKIVNKTVGIDFSSKMIKIANKKFKRKNINFINDSIFNYHADKKFDVISAVGFLEYLSFEEINKVINYCFKNLNENGILVLGSRNRLYNLFSLNRFTKSEIQLKTYKNFLKEAMDLNKLSLNNFLKNNKNVFEETPFNQPTTTNIKVNVRNQFTPGQINSLLNKHKFRITDLFPINYHPVSPAIYNNGKKQMRVISNFIMGEKNKLPLIPFSSSFIISAKKIK
jgi:2-polyprenyl-3-methyl-5-hydroxy-6-metoxy-1,4-benzoquinol methylase